MIQVQRSVQITPVLVVLAIVNVQNSLGLQNAKQTLELVSNVLIIVLALQLQLHNAYLINASVVKVIVLVLSSRQNIVHQVLMENIVESVKAMINAMIIKLPDALLEPLQAIAHLAMEMVIVITLIEIIIVLIQNACSALLTTNAEMMLPNQDAIILLTTQFILVCHA